MPQVTIRVNCSLTEDSEKVLKALINIFPEANVEELEKGFIARTSSIDRFKEILRRSRILDAARSILIGGRRGNSTAFSLNKQAAYMGKVSFVDDDVPLGPIEVVIEDDRLDALIDDIAPETVEGEIP